MDIQFHFTNVESSDALKEHARKLIDKVSLHFNRIISTTIRFKIERNEHVVEITINGDRGVFVAEGRSNDMYASLDIAEKKIEKQVIKHREKYINH